jgi:BASS family bile acid:Na+ symporter
MTMDQVINVLVTITLIEMMVAIGLGVTFADLVRVASDWRLVVQASLANYVLVPAATVGLLLLFAPHPMVAAGFLVLAVCPGAPFGPPFTAIAKGNVAIAVGLMVLLAGSSAFLAPLLMHLLTPWVAGDEPLQIDALKIATTLLATQLAPLLAGVAVRQWQPAWADRLRQPADWLSKLLNLATIGLILVAQFHLLMDIRFRGLVGMLILLIASWAAGWLLGGKAADVRRAMTLTTSLRNAGVGLVIASGSFAGTPAVTAVLVYALVEVFGSLVLAILWGRRGDVA